MKKSIRLLSTSLALLLAATTLLACNKSTSGSSEDTTSEVSDHSDKASEEVSSEGSSDEGTSEASTDAETDESKTQESAGSGEDIGTKSTMTPIVEGEPLELVLYNADGVEDPWDDPVAEEITKRTNIKIKTEYPVAVDDETIALMLAEGNYPDMIFAKGDGGKLIEADVLIDMTDLIEEHGPNIKKLYGEEYKKLRHSEENPAIYQLSYSGVGNKPIKTSGTAQIQWEALKMNDYKVPKDLAEYEALIKKFLEEHPTTEDGLPHIGISLSASDWYWLITLGNPAGYIAEGAPDNGQWLVDENHNAMYKFRSEKIREYMKWLNRMYAEGILDPDFATQTHEDYNAKIGAGQVVSTMATDWSYVDGETILRADGKYDKTFAPLPLTMTEDMKAPSLQYQGLTTGWGVGITTSCKDPVAAIKYIDFLASDEGQVLTHWGIEGVNYQVDENGRRYRTQEEIDFSLNDRDYQKKTGVGFHITPFPTYGDGVLDPSDNTYTVNSKEEVIANYDPAEKAAVEAWGVELLTDIFPQPEEFEVPAFPAIWAYNMPAEFTEILNILDEISWSGLVSMIIDSPDNFDASYDKLIADLEAADMARAEEILSEMIKAKAALAE